jgi:hypothetical protein
MRGSEPLDKLAILRREDHFRDWRSLDDERICVLCGRNFAGREVILLEKSDRYKLRCPTRGCCAQVHQWTYSENPLRSEKADDWWKALGDSLGNKTV